MNKEVKRIDSNFIRTWYFPAIIYLFIVLIDVLALFIYDYRSAPKFLLLSELIKPSLMPVLAACTLLAFKEKYMSKAIISLVMLALFFYWMGDIFLMFNSTDFFIAGLLSFLLGHLCIIFTLCTELPHHSMYICPINFKRTSIYLLISIIIPLAIIIYSHCPHPVYVALYAWALLSIACIAFRALILGVKGSAFILAGALFYIFSDLLLAAREFAHLKFIGAASLVMLTYTTAVALIIFGISRAFKYKK